MEPLGIRNNNPGNIRRVAGVKWYGEDDMQVDPAFVQFTNPIYGIRAIARVMKTYEQRGINTLREAIDRWAPPNENNSQAYVEAVCQDCAIGPDDVVSLQTILPQLVKAIIQHENGEQPYTDRQISVGISLI
jgi:hypothetical protein